MGRKLVLVLLGALLCACTGPFSSEKGLSADLFPACGNPVTLGNGVVLLPHHLLVEDYIEAMYEALEDVEWKHVVIVSPDHFHTGPTHISPAAETEHGFTIHRDYAAEYFPDATVEGFMIQTDTSEQEVLAFMDELQAFDETSTLFIFSIDFSHYLPGGIAYVHDLYSMDVLGARAIDAARSLEVDSPIAVEILLRLLRAKNVELTNMEYTNPSYDIGVDTFENTTHVFACSSTALELNPERSGRALTVQMFFAHPREWYLGKTAEDRYLYGVDEMLFNQGGSDRAVIVNHFKGTTSKFTFDYFE